MVGTLEKTSISKSYSLQDVCLLYFPGILKLKYKLVRVVEVHPDEKGIVRTVAIIYKKKNAREKATDFSKNKLVKDKVGVQRLIVIQPANDNHEETSVQQSDVSVDNIVSEPFDEKEIESNFSEEEN